MKDTGKTFKGVKAYTDPDTPPNTIFLLGNFVSQNPRRSGKLLGVTKITWKERLIIFWWVIPLIVILILLFISAGHISDRNNYFPIPIPVYVYTYRSYE